MKKKSTLIKNGHPLFDILCDIINTGFEKGMSQGDIATAADQYAGTLSAWINGRGAPNLHTLLKLAKATGFPLRVVLAAHGFTDIEEKESTMPAV